ncbi:unnamed protein product [Toxocara canis]|uniref:Zf-C3Hc3H domain-containing protein n=1 Tax=Toxocara canis TaxID=6265 RepID=A0A183UYJ0_TOXCA|nr:unnamed protein product [Toxocara canis]
MNLLMMKNEGSPIDVDHIIELRGWVGSGCYEAQEVVSLTSTLRFLRLFPQYEPYLSFLLGSETKTNAKRRKRAQKRAWKLRVPREEQLGENCAKCQYVSRRIGIACDNVRKRSELSSLGICEQHMRFARQLKQLYIAEQYLSDRGDFIAPRVDEDGIVSVRNAEAISEKELLMCRLAALENKMAAIKEYREVLALKQMRYEAYLKKKIIEEAKKGQLVAETRKEKRQMRMLRACKRYDRWRNSKTSKMMRQKLLARLKAKAREAVDGSNPENQLDYLNVGRSDEDHELPICSFIYEESAENEDEEMSGEESSKKAEGGESKKVKGRQCTELALPRMNYCLRHVFENGDQQMFAACLECGAAALDFDDGDHYCFSHISKKNANREQMYGPLEVRTSFDFSSTSTPPSSIRASSDSTSNLLAQSASHAELTEQISSENSLDKGENLVDTSESQSEVASAQLNEMSLKLDNLELKAVGGEVLYEGEGPDAPPIKFILIDSEDEEGNEGTVQPNKPEDCSAASTVQRPPAPPSDVASRQPSTNSTLVSPQRYITIEQRTHSEEGPGGSQTTIQKLRSGGPYPHSEIHIHNQRRSSTPTNPNFAQPIPITASSATRSLVGSSGYHTSTSMSKLTDPSTISLSSSSSVLRPQSPPHIKRSTIMHRSNPPLRRGGGEEVRQIRVEEKEKERSGSYASVHRRRLNWLREGPGAGQRWRTPQAATSLHGPRVHGSARSRLVPVDPSPTVYYSQPRYRSYIVPRPVRNFPREHPTSVRRLALPRDLERDRQQSMETAAAVASIASLDDRHPQDAEEEHLADANFSRSEGERSHYCKQKNALPVATVSQNVKRAAQEMGQPSRTAARTEGEVRTQASHTSGHRTEFHTDERAAQEGVQVPIAPEKSAVMAGDRSKTEMVLSQGRSVENVEDGLALLADTAASQAAAIHRHQSVSEMEQMCEEHVTLPFADPVSQPTVELAASPSSMTQRELSGKSLESSDTKRSQLSNFGLELEDEGSD